MMMRRRWSTVLQFHRHDDKSGVATTGDEKNKDLKVGIPKIVLRILKIVNGQLDRLVCG
jgi:hypothetical protein